jgi:HEAT repeat protein
MAGPRGKWTAGVLGLLGGATVLAAVIANRIPILERWYEWRTGSTDAVTRREAVEGLVRLRSPRAVPFLLEDLGPALMVHQDPDSLCAAEHRGFAALLALGKQAVPALIGCLDRSDWNPEARVWAARTLPSIIDSLEIHAALRRAAADGNALVARAAQGELYRLDVALLVRDGNPEEKTWAAANLAAPQRRGVIPILIDALRDPDALIRLHLARLLGRLGRESEAALPQLKAAALDDPDPEVRTAAGEAIEKIKGTLSSPLPARPAPPPGLIDRLQFQER